MINQSLSETLAVGLHGSIYKQLTGDKGAGATFGSFKGEAYSIGPALMWYPKIDQKEYYFSAKWLHEFAAKNRFEGELYIFSAGLSF